MKKNKSCDDAKRKQRQRKEEKGGKERGKKLQKNGVKILERLLDQNMANNGDEI